MGNDDLITSSVRRFLKLSGLMGRVGASVVGSRLGGLARSEDSRRRHHADNLVRNAVRVVETLGELKGAAMKVGQMLSLHEGLLPAEVAAVLRSLQKQAPAVPFEVMEYEIRGQLGDDYDRLFERLEPEAFAAASIGQVHRARLRDGRDVAVKIQYPLIEQIIRADLGNLRTVSQALFGLFSRADFEPVWREVRDRLLEELDYTLEAENIRTLATLHADVPEIVIPAVIDEASTRRVLTMELVEGIPPEQACSPEQDRDLRDRWGVVLFEFVLRGLCVHRVLHADPNLANFAFRPDGRVVVYDFGSVKRVPRRIARGYARLLRAVVDGRTDAIPGILADMGVVKGENEPLARELTDPYVELFSEIVRSSPPYTFGENKDVYSRLMDLGWSNLPEAVDLRFPEDVVFIDRALGGHFGNLGRLKATGPWREIVERYTRSRS